VAISGEIDVRGLEAARDQLFAEAFVRFKAGERYWPTSTEQRELFDPQQLARESEDALQDMLHDWIEGLTRPEFTMGEAMSEGLKLDAGKMTRDMATRVGALLHKFGCGKRERRNGIVRFVYTVPGWASFAVAQQKSAQAGGSDGPLPI
jgi:predicted P-loop ATPase